MEPQALVGLRIMFGAAVLGAGVVGAVTVFAPALASRYVFAGAAAVDAYLRILGALWLALGLVACLGLVDPIPFAPILLVQLVYKSVWLGAVAYPALATGDREPGLVLLAALFTSWVGALLLVVPFRSLVPG